MKITSGTEISNASLLVSNRSSPPKTSDTTPPTASAPWLTMNASATNRPNASRISSTPGGVDRQLGEAEQREDQRHRPERARAGSRPGGRARTRSRRGPSVKQQEGGVRVDEQLQDLELERQPRALDRARRRSRGRWRFGPLTWNPSSFRSRSARRRRRRRSGRAALRRRPSRSSPCAPSARRGRDCGRALRRGRARRRRRRCGSCGRARGPARRGRSRSASPSRCWSGAPSRRRRRPR